MAIDPNIALGVRTPQVENPLDAYGKAAQLQVLMGQQKLLPEQLKAEQLENQTRQISLKQMTDTAAAFKSALVTNPDGTYDIDAGRVSNALAASGSGQAIPTVLEGINKYKQGIATLKETQAKVAAAHQDNGGAIGKAVKDAGYDPHLFGTLVQHGVQEGAIDPQNAAPFMKAVTDALAQDPSGESARGIVQKIADTWIAQSPKQRELQTAADTAAARTKTADIAAQKLPVELAKQSLETTKLQQETAGTQPISPADQARIDVEKQNAERAAQAQQEAARHNTVEEKQGAARIGVEQQGLQIRKVEADPFGQFGLNKTPIGGGVPGAGGALQTGEDYLRTLPPGMAAQVKAIAEGRQNPPPRASSGIALQIMNAVNQYDPQFSLQKAQIRKAFTTGSDGRNIGALNTAAVHLDQLSEVADALNNGSFRPGNQVFNAFKNMFGNAAPTNFEGIKAAVSSEMASALKGSATDQEIASIKSTIDKSASPAQLAGAVKTNLDILGAKLNTYQERYHQQIPDDKNWSPVMPTAKAVFDKHGINPTAGPANVKPAPGATPRPTATDAKGNKVEWDGTAWIPQRKQ